MSMIQNDWLEPLKPEFSKPYYAELFKFVKNEYSTRQIFPPADDIFNAFHLTPLHEVKVVILGQDPYHNDGQAHGLCFSVKPDVAIPPSLVNIYQELHDDLGCYIPNNGYLTKWAKQGVLMLNTVLTVRAPSGQFPPGYGLGAVYGRGYPYPERAGSPVGLYSLGKPGPEEGPDAEQSEASDSEGAASESSFCIPGIFRKPSF